MVDISAVRRIIMIQVAVAIVIALVMLVMQNAATAASAFVGGAIGFLSSVVYAIKMQSPLGSEPKKIVRMHYSAEGYKLIITILLFALVFTQYKEVHALALIAAYVATLAVYWVALLIV
jgi:ATP synthase protein I